MKDSRLLRRKAAAAYLSENYGIGTLSSLATYAYEGTGPEMQYIGRIPLYSIDALDAWARSRMSGPVCTARRRQTETGLEATV